MICYILVSFYIYIIYSPITKQLNSLINKIKANDLKIGKIDFLKFLFEQRVLYIRYLGPCNEVLCW